MFGYLSRVAMLAVIGNRDEFQIGKRDHVLLPLMYNTGARVSEIAEVQVGEVVLDQGSVCIHLHGKGYKQRSYSLWRSTIKAARAWLRLNPQFDATSPLSPSPNSHAMTRNNVAQRLALSVATESNPDLARRPISPHTIRHTTAMRLLPAGVDIRVIAPGQEMRAVTTHHCFEADLTMNERALSMLREPEAKPHRYTAPDSLIDFLKRL